MKKASALFHPGYLIGGIVILLCSPFVLTMTANNIRASNILDMVRAYGWPPAELVGDQSSVHNWWSSNMCMLGGGAALRPNTSEQDFIRFYESTDLSMAWVEGRTIRVYGSFDQGWETPMHCDRAILEDWGDTTQASQCGLTSVDPVFYDLLALLPNRTETYVLVYAVDNELPGLDLRCN